MLTDQVIGLPVQQALKIVDSFNDMIASRGTIEGDEDVIGDGIAFAGVAKYPARVKCALLGWMAFKDAVVRIEDSEMSDESTVADPELIDALEEAMRDVVDPELGINVVDLGLVYGMTVDEKPQCST